MNKLTIFVSMVAIAGIIWLLFTFGAGLHKLLYGYYPSSEFFIIWISYGSLLAIILAGLAICYIIYPNRFNNEEKERNDLDYL